MFVSAATVKGRLKTVIMKNAFVFVSMCVICVCKGVTVIFVCVNGFVC